MINKTSHKLYFKTRIKLFWIWLNREYWRYGKAWRFSTFVDAYKENELIKTLGNDKYLDMTKREILKTKV